MSTVEQYREPIVQRERADMCARLAALEKRLNDLRAETPVRVINHSFRPFPCPDCGTSVPGGSEHTFPECVAALKAENEGLQAEVATLQWRLGEKGLV